MTRKRKAKKQSDSPVSSKAGVMKTLWDISQSLYQYLNIDDLILHIIKRMKEVMEAEGVSVILHDGKKRICFLIFSQPCYFAPFGCT